MFAFVFLMIYVITIWYLSLQIKSRDAELVLANATISNYEDSIKALKKTEREYNELQKEHEVLKDRVDLLLDEKDQLIVTYQELVANFTDLKRKSEDFEKQIAAMSQTMQEYDYVFDYDPVLLEECQVYIEELEDKLMERGGFDKFEKPKRSREYENFTIWLEDGASVKWAEEAMSYLSKLPERFLKELTSKGWMFIITPRSLENVYGSQVTNTVGLTIYYEKRIYVQNDSFSIGYCSLHETGHAFDFLHGFLSYGTQWQEIYTSEAEQSGFDHYFTDSATEYFAQTFQAYVMYPDIVKNRTPKAYEYMSTLFEAYKPKDTTR